MTDIGRIPTPSPLTPVQPGERVKDRKGSRKRRQREVEDKDKRQTPGDKGGHHIDEYA